uniref:Uncharacterized protein n=1 Tax=Anguilla anguilla TaxID=7936 RepID=A0A0E9XF11_ANGAN
MVFLMPFTLNHKEAMEPSPYGHNRGTYVLGLYLLDQAAYLTANQVK